MGFQRRLFLKKRTIKQRFTWKKGERLKSRKLIERVFREGKSFSLFPFRVYYLLDPGAASSSAPAIFPPPAGHPPLSAGHHATPSPTPPPGSPLLSPVRTPVPSLQAGFGATTRNFKKAVDRNRIKRLSREAYRLQKQALHDHLVEKNHFLAVFFIYTGKELPDYGTVTEKIGVALQKLMKTTRQ